MKNLNPEIIQVEDPEPIFRCPNCGGVNYRLPKTKSLIKNNCKYCVDCGHLMILYNFKAIKQASWDIAQLSHLQWRLGEDGIMALGHTVEEIEEKLFSIINAASSSFHKFLPIGWNEQKETLQEHRARMAKNREQLRDSEIRKSIPKDLKKGKTRTQINKMVEKIKNKALEAKKEVAGPNVISMNEYRKSVASQ